VPSIVGVLMLYALILVGNAYPIELDGLAQALGVEQTRNVWVVLLFAYTFVATRLPVWLLLQPRDYINSHQLFIALGVIGLGLIVGMNTIAAPVVNDTPEGSPSFFPFLFITIACGAISGFHSLVSSGTTSKQLDKETDSRFVGYLGSFGEGALALVTIIAVSAGFASLADWEAMYTSFGEGGVRAFVHGGGNILATLGLPLAFAQTLLTVMAVLFAGTTMDAGVRLQRYIVQEWGVIYNITPLQNGYVATAVAVGACLTLAFGAGGADGSGGMIIWPLFGTTNQLLAGLTLLVISLMLVKKGRPSRYTLTPMIFVTSMAFLSALYQLWDLYTTGNYFLVFIDMLIITAAVLVGLEAASALVRERRVAKTAPAA
ncbi:MAG: carbon starvation protein A, partial [Vicinamibacteria bacterium]